MNEANAEWQIAWHCGQLFSSEHCTLTERRDGFRLTGVVVVPFADAPCHIDYSVEVDGQWAPQRVLSTITSSSGRRVLELHASETDRWHLDGVRVAALDGCSDVDLGWTPATNTVPIRRLDIDVGESQSILAAWIRFPELDVVPNVQTYTKLANDRWRYESGPYSFELVVDQRTGLVLAYGDDLWRASAFSKAST